MPRHTVFVLTLTFVAGFATGVFLFFRGKEPGSLDTAVLATPVNTGFEIVGYTYGGCARLGCTSYRIQADGSYTYIARNAEGKDERHGDMLSSKRIGELRDSLRSSDLSAIARTKETGTCPAEYDGIAYRYEIRDENGMQYSFDSCTEALSGTSFFSLLRSYFELFNIMYKRTP